MNLAIFGASGATGTLLTERALAAGHTVCALIRSLQTFPYKGSVRVVQGSVFDPASVAATLAGADAVLSALGAKSLRKEDVLERAIPVIAASMEASGPRRIVVLGSAGALGTALDKQPAWRRWFVQNIVFNTFLKYPVASQRAQYATLCASSLDWTMIMPPMLTDGPARGTYRVDPDALPANGSRISRADVADFMMLQLTSPDFIRRGVYLSW